MKWFKYKQRQASGVDDEWTFVFVPDWVGKDQSLENYLDDGQTLDNWSELYRGITYKRVYKAPQREILKKINNVKDEIENNQEELDYLQEQLSDLRGRIL